MPLERWNLELKDDMEKYLKDEISSNKVKLVAFKFYLQKILARGNGKMHLQA